MTHPKRPLSRSTWRVLRLVAQRAIVLIAVALFAVAPSLSVARTIVAISSAERTSETGPADAFEEEESLESAALHRHHHIEIRRAEDRWQTRVAAAPAVLRHRIEQDGLAAARRWERYQAPPRAPPHRLLN